MKLFRPWLWLTALAAACDTERASELRAPRAASAPPSTRIVDSALPLTESVRRFRDGLPVVDGFAGASPSRDALVARFIRAVEQSDTGDLRAMVMTRAEFAFLYYPESPHTRPPTVQPPGVVWFLHLQNSQQGVSRVLARFGGTPLPVRGYACLESSRTVGALVVWDDCTLRFGRGADTASRRLFGGIVEHRGQFKVFSFANDF